MSGFIPSQPGSPPGREARLRASDRDRAAAARHVREATADGRLDLDEMAGRLDRVLAARTLGDLDAVLDDLVAAQPSHPPAAGDGDVLHVVAGVASRKQAGVWVCPPRIVARTPNAGSVTIDFTEAVADHDVVHVEVATETGRIVLVVPPGWTVDASGVATPALGSVKNKLSARPDRSKPRLVITGTTGLGNVIVRHPRTTHFLPR